jgi:hypothetical protein
MGAAPRKRRGRCRLPRPSLPQRAHPRLRWTFPHSLREWGKDDFSEVIIRIQREVKFSRDYGIDSSLDCDSLL